MIRWECGIENFEGLSSLKDSQLKGLYDISGVEVDQHFYWQIGGFQAFLPLSSYPPPLPDHIIGGFS